MTEEQQGTPCALCPRKCGADRAQGGTGFCAEGAEPRIASAGLHFGEEPPVTGLGGSGTIFFSGCTLKCSFCQNYQISWQGMGKTVSRGEFVGICLKLQEMGAHNINLVTGSHFIPETARWLRAAKAAGLSIPVAWNSSAYETTEALELLSDVVDIWLPDLKTLNPVMSESLFRAGDYPQAAKKAIRWMVRNSGLSYRTVSRGKERAEVMERGVIVRHLFMPGRMDDTIMALDWLKKNVDGRACVSLMSQYTPVPFKGTDEELRERSRSLSSFQNRPVNAEEDRRLRSLIDSYGFECLFYQDLSDDTSWLPDFGNAQPFPNSLARPVWHWKHGMLA